jgi:ribosomal protein S18 acetylase RimI-like enzyme
MFAPLSVQNETLGTGPWEKMYMGDRSKTLCIQARNVDTFLDDLAAIYREAFGGAPWFESWSLEASRAEIISCAQRGALFVVSMDSDTATPLGFGVGLPMTDRASAKSFLDRGLLTPAEAPKTYYIAELCTAGTARNRGICSDILGGLVQAAQSSGYTQALTRTRTDNDGMIRIFTRAGFTSVAEYQTTTGGVPSERIVFRSELRGN